MRKTPEDDRETGLTERRDVVELVLPLLDLRRRLVREGMEDLGYGRHGGGEQRSSDGD
jgi:hypothetical protein